MSVPTASSGLLPSLRSTRTAPGACTSFQALSTGTTATVAAGDQSVPFQNNRRPGPFGSAVLLTADAVSIKILNLGEAKKCSIMKYGRVL